MKNLLIYSPVITERLVYILDFLWESDYQVTTSSSAFLSSSQPKINYSLEKIDDQSYWIYPIGLLEKENIESQSCEITYWKDLPIFFQSNGDLPFDILGAAFYLVSRYEEYLPHKKDSYGRFSEKNSLAFQGNFLQLPLVDIWLQQLEILLQERFAHYSPKKKTFQYLPTFDIDIPFSYLHKPFYLKIGALAKAILRRNFSNVSQQIAVLQGKRKDPYDNFELLESEMEQYNLHPIYFFPAAQKRGKYDKNPLPQNLYFQQLIRTISGQHAIGIHPSWQSGDDKKLLLSEKNFLEKTTDIKITKSRQHYIRMQLPQTYQDLIAAGIEEDYSMGYGNTDGFRASTSKPFYWFDLSQNKITTLKIHPFCWMDATAIYHTKDTPDQLLKVLQYYHHTIQKTGGQMIMIMHNNYFASTPDMLPYRQAMLSFWEKCFSETTESATI